MTVAGTGSERATQRRVYVGSVSLCHVGAFLCTAIDRGEHDPSAQARCSATGAAPIELVMLTGCRAPLYLTVSGARVPCRVARDVGRSWQSSTCTSTRRRGDVCRIPRWTCTLTRIHEYAASVDYISRCRSDSDRRQAVAVVWNTG